MSTYGEKLKSPTWQRKRLEVLNKSEWCCDNCGCKTNQLHVHHYYYRPSIDPWDYLDDCYGSLCDKCHKEWHEHKQDIDERLAGTTVNDLRIVSGLIAGYRCASEYRDYLFTAGCDGLFITAFVRGFWPPVQHMNAIIDACLSNTRDCGLWFSDAVNIAVNWDECKSPGLAYWYKAAEHDLG